MQSTDLFKVVGDGTVVWGINETGDIQTIGYARNVLTERSFGLTQHFWGNNQDPVQTLVGQQLELITITVTMFTSQWTSMNSKIKDTFTNNTFTVDGINFYVTSFSVEESNNDFTKLSVKGFRKNLN